MAAALEELEQRVALLEKGQQALEQAQNDNTLTLKWVAGTLAQVKMLADDHTERLQRIEASVSDQAGRLDRIEHDVKGLRRDMPAIVADALRHSGRTDQGLAGAELPISASGASHCPALGASRLHRQGTVCHLRALVAGPRHSRTSERWRTVGGFAAGAVPIAQIPHRRWRSLPTPHNQTMSPADECYGAGSVQNRRCRRTARACFLLPLDPLHRIEITDCGLASGQSPALVALEPRHVAHQIEKDGR